MILLVGVAAGLVAGLIRARVTRRPLQPVQLKSWWLVFVAYIPQFLAFGLPRPFIRLPDEWIPFILIGSQTILLAFAGLNYKQTGGWLLGLGLVLNLMVIILNGGFMPISPEAVQILYPDAPAGSWRIGERLGLSKDMVLSDTTTRLGVLSDRFLVPAWLHYPVAFSIGDIIIALGAFWFLWSIGGAPQVQKT